MRIILSVIMIVVVACTAAYAGAGVRTITLKDGSTVQGRITGIDNGKYVVESPALGEVRIQEDNVVSIVAAGNSAAIAQSAAGAQPVAAVSEDQLQAAQAKIMADPQAMADIQSIVSDPEIVKLVSDPAFMQAATSRDAAAIQANPRTAELMKNPKVKALIEKLQAEQAAK